MHGRFYSLIKLQMSYVGHDQTWASSRSIIPASQEEDVKTMAPEYPLLTFFSATTRRVDGRAAVTKHPGSMSLVASTTPLLCHQPSCMALAKLHGASQSHRSSQIQNSQPHLGRKQYSKRSLLALHPARVVALHLIRGKT